MNQGILGPSRARGGSPARPIATRAEAFAGTDRGSVVTPETLSLSRRGTGRAWFWELFNDFAMTSGGGVGDAGTDGCLWFNQSSGTGSGMSTSQFPFRASDYGARNVAGTMGIFTGTTTSGRGGFDSTSGITTHRFDTGVSFMEALINLQSLATVTDDYVFRWGHTFGNGSYSEQLCWEYNRANSTNWVGVASFNSTATRWDTGIPVVAGQWIRLRATWDASNCYWQVNDLPVVGGSATTIRPDGSGRFGGHIIKTAGTTSVGVGFDYVYYRHDFTNERTYS